MVYLLHFNEKLSHAQHYIGFVESSERLDERIKEHRTGRGARITQVLKERNMGFVLAATFEGGREKESWFKHSVKNSKHYCPICCKEHQLKLKI